jgi:hypothetical protein
MRFIQQFAKCFRRDPLRAACTDRLLFERVCGGHEQAKLRRIFARQSLDDCIGRLTNARIKNLDLARICAFGDLRSAPVENHDHAHAGPILIITQSFDERVSSQRGAALMKCAQLRPSEDDAMTVDQEIL